MSDALAESVVVLVSVEPAVGDVREMVGRVVSRLLTVTVTVGADVLFPAVSYAIALSTKLPLILLSVFHTTEYGAVVSDTISVVPTYISTFATPTLSEALAKIVTLPLSVEPAVGDVIDTVGAVMSGLFTVTLTVDEVPVLFELSLAIAFKA